MSPSRASDWSFRIFTKGLEAAIPSRNPFELPDDLTERGKFTLNSYIPAMSTRTQTSSYRPEIDGLRGLAVIAVIMFHAEIALNGGYVGVDIFFVISGYLITSLIVKELQKGTFTFTGFWERRIRRIIPAMSVMVIVVLVAGWFLLLPEEYVALGKSAIALAAVVANIYFWRNTNAYFADGEEMPLLHSWSLAVEEQFYLIMPFFLVLAFRLSSPRGRLLLPVVIVSMFGSLAASEYAVRVFPGGAFYFLPSRAWELLIGSILALMPAGWIPSSRLVRETTTYAGLACIAVPCLFYTKATPFPGFAALIPCAGTAAIIWANTLGSSGMSLTSAGSFLALRPCVFLGLISYSLYLWHWPLLSFSNHWSVLPLSLTDRLGLIALAFLLAILSWWFVELPIRRRAVFPARSSLLSFAGLYLLVVFAFGGFVFFTRGYPPRLPDQALLYAQAEGDQARHYDRKTKDIRSNALPRFGVTDHIPSVLLWGDSQAYCLLPAFDVVGKDLNFSGVAITHGARAPLLDGIIGDNFGRGEDLPRWADAVVEYVAAHKIKDVFLACFWEGYVHKYDRDHFAGVFLETVRALNDAGSKVWVVLQLPSHDAPVAKSLVRSILLGAGSESWQRTHNEHLRRTELMLEIERLSKGLDVTFLDPAPLFYDPSTKRYRVEEDGKALYYDQIHITITTALNVIAPWLRVAVGKNFASAVDKEVEILAPDKAASSALSAEAKASEDIGESEWGEVSLMMCRLSVSGHCNKPPNGRLCGRFAANSCDSHNCDSCEQPPNWRR
jgi:peptidoglycan/LPS O-acetylase OafA/YrhL